MKKAILIFLVVILLVIAIYLVMKNNTNYNINSTEPPVVFSTDNYTVFSKSYNSQFLSGYSVRYTPSEEDVQKGLNLIELFLNKQSNIRDLSEYKIQIIGYKNNKDEKIIYANYFCGDSFTDWKNNFVMVLDGGNCFFNAKVNLQTKEVFDFIVNGDA